jgi:hypothetical protein
MQRWILAAFTATCAAFAGTVGTLAQVVRVDTAPEHIVNRIAPSQALGGGVDRISVQAIDKTMTPEVLKQTAPTGWGPMTYRQNTDLSVEAWHWNPKGTWSDARGRGYFTGSSQLGEPISYSFGYSLPRRGSTRNDGTGDSGYSMLTDGDLNTFWKSNPYLSERYTGEDDALHPQWIVIDLKQKESVNAVRIAWGEPYARRYQVQYWVGTDPIGAPALGFWAALPNGVVSEGTGGSEVVRFAQEPMPIQYLRVLMSESSNTCDADGPSDPRNCVGYAVREVYVGTQSADGKIHDAIRHTADQDQTTTYSSSVDPWHEPSRLMNQLQAQPGFDRFFTSGVTHGLPAMIPIAMAYNQPEDAVEELRYLEARHYPVSWVEMGEEVDGQYMSPEDNAALYIQFARALHEFDPKLKLGGPAFQGSNEDIVTWPDAEGRTSWLQRFLAYLKAHGAMKEMAFFSFEHYPLAPCHFSWNALYDEPKMVSHILQVWKADGLPAEMPVLITESNLSSGASEAYYDNFAGLWLADYVGSFLASGGDGLYIFHYLPLKSYHGCRNSSGTFGMFSVDNDFKIMQPLAQYFASQMLIGEWLMPGDGLHQIHPASATLDDGAGHMLVTAYAAQRPDKKWSVLLVNRDQENAHDVRVVFQNGTAGAEMSFDGNVESSVFGSGQYQWHASGVLPMSHPDTAAQGAVSEKPVEGYADPDGPLVRTTLQGKADGSFTIPPASILVLKGTISSSK